MASIFTRIIEGEIPCYKVAEDENHFAFLDINPIAIGHTLVVPKREIDELFDLSDDEMANISVFSKKIAVAIKKAIPCLRVGSAVIGLEVPHAHIHLIPLNSMSDASFEKPKLKLSKEKFESIAEAIATSIV